MFFTQRLTRSIVGATKKTGREINIIDNNIVVGFTFGNATESDGFGSISFGSGHAGESKC